MKRVKSSAKSVVPNLEGLRMAKLPKDITFLDNPVYAKLKALRLELLQDSDIRYNRRILKIIIAKLHEIQMFSLLVIDRELPCPECNESCCVCEVEDIWRAHCTDCDFELGPFDSEDIARSTWNENARRKANGISEENPRN